MASCDSCLGGRGLKSWPHLSADLDATGLAPTLLSLLLLLSYLPATGWPFISPGFLAWETLLNGGPLRPEGFSPDKPFANLFTLDPGPSVLPERELGPSLPGNARCLGLLPSCQHRVSKFGE